MRLALLMHRGRRLFALLALLSFGLSATETLYADMRVEVDQRGIATVLAADMIGSHVPGSDSGRCPPGCSCPCPCACPSPCLLQPDPPFVSLVLGMGSSIPVPREDRFSSLSRKPRVPPPLP